MHREAAIQLPIAAPLPFSLPAVVLVAVVVIDGGAMCDDAWPCRWASALCAATLSTSGSHREKSEQRQHSACNAVQWQRGGAVVCVVDVRASASWWRWCGVGQGAALLFSPCHCGSRVSEARATGRVAV